METMFYGCYSLQTIPALDTSNVTTMRYMFYSCSSLQELVLTGGLPSSISASNAAINLSNSCMGRTSMVAFFQSLPNITGATAQGALITYTGTPAVLTLTAADKLIATGKGWVLNPA
jgi:surface protein